MLLFSRTSACCAAVRRLQFKLNERFKLDVQISFTSHQPSGPGTIGNIRTRGHLSVKVDVPPPFSLMPRQVLETTGNTAMQTTLTLLLVRLTPSQEDKAHTERFVSHVHTHTPAATRPQSAFLSAMAKDYRRWAMEQQKLQLVPVPVRVDE
jgi:hypothetical protein